MNVCLVTSVDTDQDKLTLFDKHICNMFHSFLAGFMKATVLQHCFWLLSFLEDVRAAQAPQCCSHAVSVCVVRGALDGGELLAFQKVLPYSFQAEDVEEFWQLGEWKVVSSQEPLQSLRFTEDVCEVTVVKHTMPKRIPRNVWVASWKWEGPGAAFQSSKKIRTRFKCSPVLFTTA